MTATVLESTRPAPATFRRSVLAVFAGLLANAVLSTVTDLLLVAAGVFPPLSQFGDPGETCSEPPDGAFAFARCHRLRGGRDRCRGHVADVDFVVLARDHRGDPAQCLAGCPLRAPRSLISVKSKPKGQEHEIHDDDARAAGYR